jgi:mannitol 2-dehydrogenase
LKAKDDPKAFLAMTDIFGEVGTSPIFTESFSRILRTLWDKGARETLRLYLDDKL